MKRFKTNLCCFAITLASGTLPAVCCTSAIIGAGASPYGRPMLWKNRDTSNIDNKVEYIPSSTGTHSYVALFNADDLSLEQAWIGFNETGFAVMNTASYNIKDDKVPEKDMDREGYVMTRALQICRTVDDFANLLDTLPRPMGVEANFGVIDASGNGAYFETNNHSYVRFDIKDEPSHVLIRTNYSHSGRKDEGYGFVREANAGHFILPELANGGVTPEFLTETVSRSFWHSMLGRDCASQGDRWIIDQDFIPRYKSSATVVIEGMRPEDFTGFSDTGNVVSQYIMWTGLGYPPCAETMPVYCRPDGIDPSQRGTGKGGHSEASDRARVLRDKVFPIHKGNGDKYIDTSVLFGGDDGGLVRTVVDGNLKRYGDARRKRDAGD